MRYAFFLGCVMPHRYPGIEAAIRKSFSKLGIELLDMEGATCCPAPGVVGSFDKETWVAIAARNLALAEQLEADLMTACNGCFGTLNEVNHLLKSDSDQRARVNEILKEVNKKYAGTIDVKHFTDVLYHDVGPKKLASSRTRDISNLKLAIHYGCHYLRPKKIRQRDNPEDTHTIEEMVNSLGAEVVHYKDERLCCGAGGGLRMYKLDTSLELTMEKLENIQKTDANCILNICPFCHLQLDIGQWQVNNTFKKKFNIPVLHLAQVLGIAMGLSFDEIGVADHKIEVIQEKLGIKA